MKTRSERSVRRLWQIVGWLGGIGVVSGFIVESPAGLIASALLWMFTDWLIRKAWVFVGEGWAIRHCGAVIMRADEAKYIAQASLPDGFSVVCIRKDVAIIKETLFVISQSEGGSIVPLEITIGAVVGEGTEAVALYCSHFNDGKPKKGMYAHTVLRRFQREHERASGIFGDAYGATIGTCEWVEHVFAVKLRDFMEKEFSLIGLQIKTIEIVRGDRGRSILQKKEA